MEEMEDLKQVQGVIRIDEFGSWRSMKNSIVVYAKGDKMEMVYLLLR